jgi:hypothetical protein
MEQGFVTTPVPEPSMLLPMGVGLALLGLKRRRTRRNGILVGRDQSTA